MSKHVTLQLILKMALLFLASWLLAIFLNAEGSVWRVIHAMPDAPFTFIAHGWAWVLDMFVTSEVDRQEALVDVLVVWTVEIAVVCVVWMIVTRWRDRFVPTEV
ncbi:hypothetical protein KSF73_07835 [Burkholderiaceae bacterium DAT-1]|nr:hypothetical protein [Burkholderiaceae bacterium DAT-1]